jgi:branched-chain amino acid aminotransferase
MIGKFFSLNGELKPVEKAVIGIDNLEFTYGYGVYEALKVRKRKLYFVEEHSTRLLESASIIKIQTRLNSDTIKEWIITFAKSVKEDSFNIKVLFVGQNLYIFATNPKYLAQRNQGVKVVTAKGERKFPQAKTLNMLESYIIFTESSKKEAYDALVVNHDGKIREGTRTNFFYTDGTTIFTAPAAQVLNGVTRSTLLKVLESNKIPVEEKELDSTELSQYTGFFLTSTSSKVVPISQIDERSIEIPEIVTRIMKLYDEFLDNYSGTQI